MMLKNYFKIAFRNLIKHKMFSIITIVGLSSAMATAILLFLFVNHELSYDSFHDGADRIYRLITVEKNKGITKNIAMSMFQHAPALRTVPGIEAACNLSYLWDYDIKYNNVSYPSQKMFYADGSFSDVFTVKVLSGDIKRTLSGVSSIVITNSFSKKLFGTQIPIGKQIIHDCKPYFIETVIEDFPSNSHFSFDILLPMNANPFNKVLSNEAFTYFKIDPKANTETTIANSIKACEEILKTRERFGYVASMQVQPLRDIHLYSEGTFYEIAKQGNINSVYILSSICFLILLIAVLNFANIFTARSHDRIKEIGLRKTIGGSRGTLVLQFLCESVMISLLSVLLGIFIAILFIQQFNILVDREIIIAGQTIWRMIIAGFIIALGAGILAGFYPAIYVSRFSPTNIFIKKISFGKNNKLMAGTVIVQFSIVIIMFSLVMILLAQIEFMKNKDLGFNKNQVFVFEYFDYQSYSPLRNTLLKNPKIVNVTASHTVPGQVASGQEAVLVDTPPSNPIKISECRVQDHFLETYEMGLIKGRDFQEDSEADRNNIIINEAAVKQLGLSIDKAIGTRLLFYKDPQTIIGVVKDYHFSSMRSTIEPLILSHHLNHLGYVSLRLKPEDISGTIKFIKETVAKFNPQINFTYFFIDDSFMQMYKKEETENTILEYSLLIVITLASLGLLALTSLIAYKRTKEIGIRKVLGATVTEMIMMLSINILKYVLVANLFAWPLAWIIGQTWLESFAYRIDIAIWPFLLSGLLALLLAVLTVSMQAIKAAFANPVISLRSE